MVLLHHLTVRSQKWKSQNCDLQTWHACNSSCTQYINKSPCSQSLAIELDKWFYSIRRPEETGRGQSKMTASKLERRVTQFVTFYKIATTFKVLHLCFAMGSSNRAWNQLLYPHHHTGRNRKWKIEDSGLQTWNTCDSACTQDKNEVWSATPIFSRSSYQMGLVVVLYHQTGKKLDIKNLRWWHPRVTQLYSR